MKGKVKVGHATCAKCHVPYAKYFTLPEYTIYFAFSIKKKKSIISHVFQFHGLHNFNRSLDLEPNSTIILCISGDRSLRRTTLRRNHFVAIISSQDTSSHVHFVARSLRRKTLRRKTLRRKTLRRKTLRRKTLRRKNSVPFCSSQNNFISFPLFSLLPVRRLFLN